MSETITLLHDVRALVSRHQWLAEKHGLNFNIFDILKLSSDEVRGHSRFLAALLDPAGSHGLGCVFLDLLLKHLRGSGHPSARFLPPVNPSMNWSIDVEQGFNVSSAVEGDDAVTGRIDLLLECGDVCLIIENKIYAGDQDRQLERYDHYARSRNKIPVVVYLTLDGGTPDPGTLGSLSGDRVIPVGYGGLIDRWLDECVRAAAMVPTVRESIAQYQRLIRRLAGGGMGKELTMEIVEELLKRPANLEAAIEIEKAIAETKTRIHWSFWQKLRGKLEPLGSFGPPAFHKNFAPTREAVAAFSRGNRRDFGLSFLLDRIGAGQSMALAVTVYEKVYYALIAVEDDQWQKPMPEKPRAQAVNLCQWCNLDAKRGEWSLYLPSRTPLPFWTFDPPCPRLADPSELDRHVDAIAAEFSELITILRARVNQPTM